MALGSFFRRLGNFFWKAVLKCTEVVWTLPKCVLCYKETLRIIPIKTDTNHGGGYDGGLYCLQKLSRDDGMRTTQYCCTIAFLGALTSGHNKHVSKDLAND